MFITTPSAPREQQVRVIDGGNDAVATLIDEGASTTYVGTATVGSTTSSGVWRIKRLSTSGTVTTIAWADGNSNYDNVWDDRASLSYS